MTYELSMKDGVVDIEQCAEILDCWVLTIPTVQFLERMVSLARAEERERCAKIADEWASDAQREFGNGGPAAAIRALGNEK